MNLIPIFSSFIIHETLSLDYKSIESFCYQKLNGEEAALLSLNEEQLSPLFTIINNKFNELHKMIGIKLDSYQVIKESWINLNNREAITRPHCHPKSFFVAVYYPKCTDGFLLLENPNKILEHIIPCAPNNNVIEYYNQYNSVTWKVPVRTDQVVIFPAWLYHSVNGYKDKQDRISIAFNSEILTK